MYGFLSITLLILSGTAGIYLDVYADVKDPKVFWAVGLISGFISGILMHIHVINLS